MPTTIPEKPQKTGLRWGRFFARLAVFIGLLYAGGLLNMAIIAVAGDALRDADNPNQAAMVAFGLFNVALQVVIIWYPLSARLGRHLDRLSVLVGRKRDLQEAGNHG